MSDKYIEIDGKPVPEDDLLAWGRWLETADRKIARTKTLSSEVSTVFLGLDHSFGSGPPLLYETMVFGGPFDQEQDRYSTREEALAGHAKMVEKVTKGTPKRRIAVTDDTTVQ